MRYTQPTPLAQAPPSTARQCIVPMLLATATALLTVAPSFWDALWPLAWVALLPLFLALREASPGRALLLGWWAETVMYWVGFYWLIGTMVRFGALVVPVTDTGRHVSPHSEALALPHRGNIPEKRRNNLREAAFSHSREALQAGRRIMMAGRCAPHSSAMVGTHDTGGYGS